MFSSYFIGSILEGQHPHLVQKGGGLLPSRDAALIFDTLSDACAALPAINDHAEMLFSILEYRAGLFVERERPEQ